MIIVNNIVIHQSQSPQTPQVIILYNNHVEPRNQLMQEYFPTSLNVITN